MRPVAPADEARRSGRSRYRFVVANEVERARWNDARWTASWPERERLTEALTPYVVEAASPLPGERVCDVGCGGGALTVELAGLVGLEGRTVGVDISAPLLELARHRASGIADARFTLLDVQTERLDEDPFDLVVSQLGVMFFDEPQIAFAAIRRLLAPGGRFVFACWQAVERNPWHVGTALAPLLPPPAPPAPGKSPVGPFVLGDDATVRALLGGAGFVGVASAAHEVTVRAPATAVGDASLLSFMGVAPGDEAEALAVLERHLARFAVGPDEYAFPLAFRIYRARSGPR